LEGDERERAREGKTGSSWEREKRKWFEDRGWRIEEVEGRREEESGWWFGEVIKYDREKQRRGRWERIGRSRYNGWYKEIKGEGIPEYLKGWGESRWRRVARFRLGNEMLGSRYWEKTKR